MRTPEEFLETLRELAEAFGEPEGFPEAGGRALSRVMGVDDEAVLTAISTVGSAPQIAAAVGRTDGDLRNERDLVGRWLAVESALNGLLLAVHKANLIRRYRLKRTTLQIYHITRQLLRQPEYAGLQENLAKMEEHLRPKRKRKAPGNDERPPAAGPTGPRPR